MQKSRFARSVTDFTVAWHHPLEVHIFEPLAVDGLNLVPHPAHDVLFLAVASGYFDVNDALLEFVLDDLRPAAILSQHHVLSADQIRVAFRSDVLVQAND